MKYFSIKFLNFILLFFDNSLQFQLQERSNLNSLEMSKASIPFFFLRISFVYSTRNQLSWLLLFAILLQSFFYAFLFFTLIDCFDVFLVLQAEMRNDTRKICFLKVKHILLICIFEEIEYCFLSFIHVDIGEFNLIYM